jgi:hypothetical protein
MMAAAAMVISASLPLAAAMEVLAAATALAAALAALEDVENLPALAALMVPAVALVALVAVCLPAPGNSSYCHHSSKGFRSIGREVHRSSRRAVCPSAQACPYPSLDI